MIISKCGCFTIETGGVILATWSVMQMIYAIGLVSMFWYVSAHFNEAAHYYGFILLLISIAVICIALLSIKGIEKRNHSFILPMLIWSFILLILQLKAIVVAAISATIALSVLSILVFLSLYDLFANEPRRGQNGRIYQQQFVPTTQNVESHLKS